MANIQNEKNFDFKSRNLRLVAAGVGVVMIIAVGALYQAVVNANPENEDATSSYTNPVSTLLNFIHSTSSEIFNKQNDAGEMSGKDASVATEDSGQRDSIVLAGGCFWCIEAFLQETPGVVDAVSGYAGGSADTATYKEVSGGSTSHREAVKVTYDPARINLEAVLDVYWSHIDPTDTGGQFADRGFQYTTAILYQSEEQKKIAEDTKNALERSGLFTDPIATKIVPYSSFYPAEEYHQDYYKKSSSHYERYKKASGRSGFIEENWAKKAALEFLESEQSSVPIPTAAVYTPRQFTTVEIEAGLKKLSTEAYKVVVNGDTEPPYKNAYYDNHEEGIYVDVVTGRPLFSSAHKYDSGTGWPSFYQALDGSNLITKTDTFLGYSRVEVRSEAGHLGHVFDDGPVEHGGKRYCMNSLALRFVPKEAMSNEGYAAYLNTL